MAAVTGTQTNQEPRKRRVVLRGTAQMFEGDDSITVAIPPNVQAAAGRQLLAKWTARLKDGKPVPLVTTLSWNALTQTQWNEMTQTQWNEMTQ